MKTTKTRIFGAFVAVIMLVSCFAASVVSADAASITFSDVKKADWHYNYVTYMAEKKIINGYDKEDHVEFRPNNYVKRSEFIKMLVETFGLEGSDSGTSFSDVKSGDWYYEYYNTAASKGIISKVFSGTEMLPNQELTREEAAALLMAYLDYPENDVVSSSMFDDYSSISSKYRTYVLQAAAADIINGFDDDGKTNFRPKEGLRRAQAAKILAIAAGTIADGGSVSSYAFDDSNNITVTSSGTISGLDDIQNVIIGEDVGSGTVNFTGCTINGRVDNRSSATVVFSGCDVNVLELNGLASTVSLKQDTEVYSLSVNVPSAKVSLYNSASVSNLTANKDSLSITTSGDDAKITNLKIYGNNTTSNITPKNLTITDGKTATIGSVKYANGLKGNVSLAWSNNTEKITFETYSSGTLYWFYSKTNSYTASTFESAYNSATSKNCITASENKKYTENLTGGNVTDENKYLIVSYKKGSTYTTPTAFDREAYKTGFKSTPTLSANASTGIVTISFSLQFTGGTTYYYLTNDETVPDSYSTAKAIWESVDSTIRQSTTGTSFASIQKEPAENYKYCVFFRTDSSNNGYKPIIVKMPTGNSNFTEKPAIVVGGADNGDDVIKFVPTFAGKITYYYTDRSMSFNNNAQLFDYFAPSNATEIHNYSFKANEKVSINIDELTESNKFLAIKITKTLTNNTESNILISMLERKIDGTGFKNGTTPAAYRVKGMTDYVAITFEIANSTKTKSVKYMFLNTNKTYTSSADFLKDYDSTENIKNEITSFTSGAELFIESTKRSYVAFLVEDSNGRYFVPKTVSVSNTGYGISNPKFTYVDTGFEDEDGNSTGVYCYLTLESVLPVKLKYKGFDKLPSTSDLNNAPSYDLNGGKAIKVGKNEIVVDKSVVNSNNYIYVYAVIDDSTTVGTLSLGDVKASYSETRYGLKLTPKVTFNKSEFVDTFDYTSVANGELKWYYTNTAPKSVSEFNTGYSSASFRNGATLSVGDKDGNFEAYPISFVSSYKYLAYLFSDGTSTTYTVRYCDVSELHTLLKDVELSKDNKTVTYTAYTTGVSVDSGNSLCLRYYYSDYKDSFTNSFVTFNEKTTTNSNGTTYTTYDSAYYSSFKSKYDAKVKTDSSVTTLNPDDYFGELALDGSVDVALVKNKQRYLYLAVYRDTNNDDGTKTYTQYGVYEFTIPAGT